ncbi:Mobile element protein [Arcticibacter svalbardensis MN12-7]|uniref:Mobile element protein n=2 Tax=Arcticibacter TaxID=1288026 RepID=R9GM08_9SPHI|nr:Mobile element protein [Arcticibacter svalbardensis MN12-7]
MMVSKSGTLSITDQCGILGIHRSGFYYMPEGESTLNLMLMQFIDAYFLKHPHTGVVTLCAYLCLSEGFTINVKRVRRLMRLMGLMAVIDVKSRYVLHWSVSNTMGAAWCTAVLSETIALYGKPQILNTDQGSQFTSHEFQKVLTDNEIQISMDGKGTGNLSCTWTSKLYASQ